MKQSLSTFIIISAVGYGLSILPLKQAAGQQGDRGMRVQQVTPAERRVALVIGNGAYKDSPLLNPVNDARDMATALRDMGFDVIFGENLSQNDMKRNIHAFGEKIRNGGVGLFYYAGHGIQVRGSNYLIPVDATITSEEEVEYESVNAGQLLSQMAAARNRLNIVILDACRNNPFARSFRSIEKGLASIDAPSGTLIAYATAPGSVASDGTGRNGLYTQELLKYMKQSDVGIEQLFKQVRAAVRSQTEGKQTPWESSSLEGDFYFSSTTNSTTNVAKNPPAIFDPATIELSFWETIKNSKKVEDYKAYLRKYPNGQFADLARIRANEAQSLPGSSGTTTPTSARMHVDRGDNLTDDKKWAEAEVEYRRAVELEPDNPVWHHKLFLSLADQSKGQESIVESMQLYQMKKGAEIEAEYRQAIGLHPQNARRRMELGSALTFQQKWVEAEEEFRQAIRIDPKCAAAHSALGYVLEYQQKYAEAEEEFRRAIRIDPSFAFAHDNLGYLLLNYQKYAEAEAEFRQAIKIDPNYQFARYYLGLILELQQKYAEAEAEYRQALRINPNYTEAQTRLNELQKKK